MSARARRRLINSALTEHPVAQETMRTYDAVLLFSRNMVQWLDGEGLSEEANLVKSVKPVILNQVNVVNVYRKLYFLYFLYPTTIPPFLPFPKTLLYVYIVPCLSRRSKR